MGNEDYLDLADEGPPRAIGGGSNPNPPIWDPKKVKLHRMVHRLLVLEERRVLVAWPAE